MAEIKVTTESWLDPQGIRDMVWSGAADRVADLTDNDLNTIIDILNSEDVEDKGIDETELNDFLWFEDDTYAEWLGYENAEDLWNHRPETDEDDEY